MLTADRINLAVAQAEKVEGWMNPIELRWLAEQASTRNVVVEIGSWKGRSTKAMAIATAGTVYSVDHWLSTPPPSAISKTKGDWEVIKKTGPDFVMNQFLANLAPEVAAGKCVPLKVQSREGVDKLKSVIGDRKIDMIFIDGDHEYEMVKSDILMWRPMMAPGSLFCGHDYHKEWPGVLKAVHELVPNHSSIPKTMIWYEKA